MPKYLSLLIDDEIVEQIPLPKKMTDQQVMDWDEMLRQLKLLSENMEVCITEDCE